MKLKFHFAALTAALSVLWMSGVTASAISPDDVAAKARRAGFSESQVQQGYNAWSTGEYTEDDLWQAYYALDDYIADTDDKIGNALGGGTETPAATEAAQTVTEAQTSPATEAVQDRIPAKDFINMTLEEKRDYVNSLPAEQRQAFIDSLSNEERNSILKQLPVDQKADIVQGLVDTAGAMGMNVSVDEISDDNIALTMRNEDGVIIDKSAVGITIDETGIDYSGKWAVAGVGVLVSAVGIGLLYRYIRKTEE